MTRGQIAQLQELSKCYMVWPDSEWLHWMMFCLDCGAYMSKCDKADLRRLWHQYRHQVAAMRKNEAKNKQSQASK